MAIIIGNINQQMNPRELAIAYAWAYIGTFYKWGGDDPSGFDCSGFICEILQAVGGIGRKEDYTAQGLFNKFKHLKLQNPRAGSLVFYGKTMGQISHVELCINDKQSIGASGGHSLTLTTTDAIRHNAFIKIRPIRTEDSVGFRAFIDPFKEI